MERPVVLVLDRDPQRRERVGATLRAGGASPRYASDLSAALARLRTEAVWSLWLDLDTPGLAATGFLARAARLRPALVVVGLRDSAAESPLPEWAASVFDVISHHASSTRVRSTLRCVQAHHRVLRELARLRREVGEQAGFRGLVGRTEAMIRLRERIAALAPGSGPVLFVGEEGTGRERSARLLHEMSARRGETFQAVDCTGRAGRPAELERWGRAGADPWSTRFRGSIFLREVDALSLVSQRRLLLHVQERSEGPRLLACTAADLARAAREGRFLEEMYRWLAQGTVTLLPLRDRRADVVWLARHFVDAVCEINDLPPVRLSPEALHALERYAWPGNVRELRDAVEQAVIVAGERVIRPRHLPESVRGIAAVGEATAGLSVLAFREAKRGIVERFERSYLEDLMTQFGGNVTVAARHAGMLRSALQRLLRKYSLRSRDFRGGPRPRTGVKTGDTREQIGPGVDLP